MWHVARQIVQPYPRVTGKPFVYKVGLMDTAVIEDDLDPPGRVEPDDMIEKVYELL